MKDRRNIFDWACLVSLIAFLILLLTAVGLLVAEYAFGMRGPTPLAPLITSVVAVMAACIFILWIESWIWLFQNWKERTVEINLALVAFIIIGPVFAAYIVHFMRARKLRRIRGVR